LILNEKGTFGRHKTTTLLDIDGGLIHTLRWKDGLIAFANDKGVGVYDLNARRLVGFENTELKNLGVSAISYIKLEYYTCGLTAVNNDLVVLGVEEFTINDVCSEPSLTVLEPRKQTCEDKTHDYFEIYRYEQTTPFQYH
ncbi:unnamed protein product, partial [Didymodactylos carnosus]